MRVAFVSGASHAMGAFTRQRELALGLVAAGVEVVWLGPRVLRPVAGVEYVEIGRLGEAFGIRKIWPRARRWLQKESATIDVFVAFGEYDVLVFSSWAKRLARPVVFFSRGDLVANEFLNLANRSGFSRGVGWARIAAYVGLRRGAVKKSDVVVVQTPQLESQLRFIDPTIARPMLVFPNNSNPSWTSPSLRASWSGVAQGASHVVGYVGRVSSNRGLEELVKAIGLLADGSRPQLEIFGPEVDGARVRELVKSLGLAERVRFRGPTASPQEEMRHMDILVANRFVEGCPNVVLEAMSVGVPMVATSIAAYRFLLGPGGVFYRPGDEEGLAHAMQPLLANRDRSEAYSRYLSGRAALFEFDWAGAAARIVISAGRRETIQMPVEVQCLLAG
jgi:glycosyltransferase involved in cell wall biosynthesis